MSINYSLYESQLSNAANTYVARVNHTNSLGLSEIADRIANMNSTVTRTDALAVLECVSIVCQNALLEGTRVNLGDLVHLFTSIRGVFNDITDTFDPKRHRIQVCVAPGKRIRKAIRENATVTKQETVLPQPMPTAFQDFGSNTTNHSITSSKIAAIKGSKLKFNPDDPTEGIFFVDCNGVATKADMIVKNKPSELMCMIPALTAAANPYTLETRARFSSGGPLRSGSIDHQLTVSA